MTSDRYTLSISFDLSSLSPSSDPQTRAFFAAKKASLKEEYATWMVKYNEWKGANPELASELENAKAKNYPSAAAVLAAIPEYDAKKNVATRQSGELSLVERLVGTSIRSCCNCDRSVFRASSP